MVYASGLKLLGLEADHSPLHSAIFSYVFMACRLIEHDCPTSIYVRDKQRNACSGTAKEV